VVQLNQRLARSRKNPLQGHLREVTVALDNGTCVQVLTNDLTASASEIADLYKTRWQIELFFKWIKQNLRIKKFLGTSENAIKLQIIAALIAFLLLRISHKAILTTVSLQHFTRLVRANLLHRKSICELLHPPPPKLQPSNQLSMELLGA
jgi:IS4 transposase